MKVSCRLHGGYPWGINSPRVINSSNKCWRVIKSSAFKHITLLHWREFIFEVGGGRWAVQAPDVRILGGRGAPHADAGPNLRCPENFNLLAARTFITPLCDFEARDSTRVRACGWMEGVGSMLLRGQTFSVLSWSWSGSWSKSWSWSSSGSWSWPW